MYYDEKIKTAFIIKKFDNKLLLKSFSYNEKIQLKYMTLRACRRIIQLIE